MNIEPLRYTHEQLINLARISNADKKRINQCRRPHNRLGFAYQLSFIRLANRFPSQDSFEVVDEILSYVSVQIGIPSKAINAYSQRRQTVDEHRERIREDLSLNRFGEEDGGIVRRFVFQEACRIETPTAILAKTEQFLRDQRILRPSDDTLRRLIGNQREVAKRSILKKIAGSLSKDVSGMLDALLTTDDIHYSPFQALKQPPGRGLLKREQLHSLARDLYYGKRGRISRRDIQEQRNSCSCLTLILACIVYWQAKEINRVVFDSDPEGTDIDLQLMEHISPVTWDNVILYGEYVLDENLVRL